MGNFHIAIEGAGFHHNAALYDVEQMTARFLDVLKGAGHTIISGTVTIGSRVDVHNARSELLPIAPAGPSTMSRGELTYQAYGDVVGWKNFAGAPMPSWRDLPEKIREAWEAAAAVAHGAGG